MELADPNFIDVHIPYPLGGLQSKWKESNILLYGPKPYERKRAISNVYKLFYFYFFIIIIDLFILLSRESDEALYELA